MVAYMTKIEPEIRYNPDVDKNLVLVSVPALAESFYKGIDQFLVDLFSNKDKAKVPEVRLKCFVQEIPVKHKQL
jgi:hypothetical protein